jgi:DNA-binding GntR family transcriptional regulator
MTASSTLAENVAYALRHAIFQGAYRSGDRLVELVIAQELNVSQNTVRDALRLLEHDGLVVKRARHGTFLRTYTPEEVTEIYTLWAGIESLALVWVQEHLTSDYLTTLWRMFDYMRGYLAQDRGYEAVATRFELHALLVEIADRAQAASLLKQLHNQAHIIENSHLPTGQQLSATYQHLLAALQSGDLDQAQAHLRRAIWSGCPAYQNSKSSSETGPVA